MSNILGKIGDALGLNPDKDGEEQAGGGAAQVNATGTGSGGPTEAGGVSGTGGLSTGGGVG
jgi:hypothetical protein